MQINKSKLPATHEIKVKGKYTGIVSSHFRGTKTECEANLARRERLNACDSLQRSIVAL